jgi:putative transposase
MAISRSVGRAIHQSRLRADRHPVGWLLRVIAGAGEAYLLFCQRDIELNPVRAGLVTDPCDYRWSSYRATGLGQHDPLLTPHPWYLALGADDAKRRAAYRDLFGSPLGDVSLSELRMALNQDQPIGNDRFYREIESMSGQRRELRKRGRSRKSKDEGLGMKASCP